MSSDVASGKERAKGDLCESIRHVLLDCLVAKVFWHQVRLGTGVKIPDLHLLSWASDLASGICSKRETAIISFVACGRSGCCGTKDAMASSLRASSKLCCGQEI